MLSRKRIATRSYPSPAELEVLFLDLMKHGWGRKGGARIRYDSVTGMHELVRQKGEIILVDRWATFPESHRSAGATTLSLVARRPQPLWRMHYWGDYVPEAVPVVMAAIQSNYEQGIFYGGRGPREFSLLGCPVVYTNVVSDFYNTFQFFEGVEQVVDKKRHLGKHCYCGMYLAPQY